jgi:putative hydrolase of HD superfamily
VGLYETVKALVAYKQTYRKIIVGDRRESDAEHSWQMAMMVWMTAPQGVDVSKAIKIALIHDLPEIITGDVPISDIAGRVGKYEREVEAAKYLATLPGLEDFHELWKEYELGESPEALLVKALDKIEPIIHNVAHGGSTWKAFDHTLEEVLGWKKPYWNTHSAATPLFEQAFEEAQRRELFGKKPSGLGWFTDLMVAERAHPGEYKMHQGDNTEIPR